MESLEERQANIPRWRVILYVVGTLLLFVFALDLMLSSLQHLGKDTVETILLATSNPFTALFIGLLITAMIQSSSTTTALVVALVASGSIQLEAAVPIIMGANVGTTITSTIVSLGFINKKKEFKRAIAAGTYHDIFNILTVIILFPLEYNYGFLSRLASYITSNFLGAGGSPVMSNFFDYWPGFGFIVDFIVGIIPSGFLLAIISFGLLFGSILLFRRVVSRILIAGSLQRVGRFFFKSSLKAFFWGIVTTGAIRSSTITTSMVVPLVAQQIVRMKKAVPFILGANLGTTVTAFMAALLNGSNVSTMSIAIVHFLFNLIGIIIWSWLPWLKDIPTELARRLGQLTIKYRLVGLVYILTFFFFIPFSLIYMNRSTVKIMEATYQKVQHTNGEESAYRIVSKTPGRTGIGKWMIYSNTDSETEPAFIYQVYKQNNMLMVNDEMFLFNRPGYCWDSQCDDGKCETCVESILTSYQSAGQSFDSVYVFNQHEIVAGDSIATRSYFSKKLLLILKKETFINGTLSVTEQLRNIEISQ